MGKLIRAIRAIRGKNPPVPLLRNISHFLAAVFNNPRDFNRRWEQPAPPPSLATQWQGRWEGEWLSEENGHHGPLRCILDKTQPEQYRAVFYAKYGPGLRVSYTVALTGHFDGAKLTMGGEMDIGQLAGGVYTYKGEASAGRFECKYRCKYDHGVFRLKSAEQD